MPARRLPVRPDLTQLKHQAKDLLKAYRAGGAEAAEDFATFHPDTIAAPEAKLADAQLVLARSYEAPSWPRLVQCCKLIDAIWEDDPKTVRRLVSAAFAHRRKALAGSLALATDAPAGIRDCVRAALVTLGHPADVRAERLSADDFRALAAALAA